MRIDEPTIVDFTLAQHNHTSPATGGPIGFPPSLNGFFLTLLEDYEIFEPPIIGVFSGNSNLIGPAGRDGRNGIDGIDGTDGVDGLQGIQGIQGIQGPTGASGTGSGGSPSMPVIDGMDGADAEFIAVSKTSQFIDIDRGIWTPSDQSGAGLVFAVNNTGHWFRLGPMVFISFDIQYPVTVNAANTRIGNLPFPVMASENGFGGIMTSTNYVASVNEITFFSNILTFDFRDTAGNAITNAAMSGKTIRGFLVYPTTIG